MKRQITLRKNNQGFTLIELMIVIAIIGILSGIAYPSYQSALRDSRRVTAEGDLIELAGVLERHYTANATYVDGASAAGFFLTSPKSGDTTYYNLSASAISATGFTVSAVPAGAQAGDYCGTLTYTNAGTKGAGVAGCW